MVTQLAAPADFKNKENLLNLNNMPFGPNQLNKPTPPWAKKIFKIFLYVTGSITIILDVFTEIPADIKLLINSSVIKANLLVHAFSEMFGINIEEN